VRLRTQVDLIFIAVIAEEQHLAAVGDKDKRVVRKGHGDVSSSFLERENAALS
jgi:hypothetical protein